MKPRLALCACLFGLLVASTAHAVAAPPPLEGVGIEEKLDFPLPPNLPFHDQDGREVKLGDYFNHGHPIILAMIYFRCPMLCSLVVSGLVKTLLQIEKDGWRPGRDYDLLTASFDPTDSLDNAKKKRKGYLQALGLGDPSNAENGRTWPFLVGTEQSASGLARSLGFLYRYDARQKQYAHDAVIFVLTPDGRISRYLYGIHFDPRDVRLALSEAGDGKSGPTLDRVLLACYHYNPAKRRYGLFVSRFIQVGALLIMLALGALLAFYVRRDVSRR